MEISNKPCASQIVLKLNDTILTRVSSHKHLGLVLNSAFTWSDHVTYICNKVSKKLGMLYKSKTRLNRNSLVKLYCSWIRPMIDYCSQCYDNLSTGDCLRLERLQRRAALTCTGAISRSATQKLFYDVGWPKLSDRRKSLRLNLIYKIINNASTHYLINDFVQTQRRISFYNFRSTDKFEIPFSRTTKFAKSFFPSTIRLWNDLPQNIKLIHSMSNFKNAILAQFPSNKLAHLFNSLNGYFAKILTHLRLGLSDLRGHLFSFNLSDNPFCPLCNNEFESTHHFLFSCSSLKVLSESYLTDLSILVPNFESIIDRGILMNICLFGMNEVSLNTNRSILSATMKYLKATDRFSRPYLNNCQN